MRENPIRTFAEHEKGRDPNRKEKTHPFQTTNKFWVARDRPVLKPYTFALSKTSVNHRVCLRSPTSTFATHLQIVSLLLTSSCPPHRCLSTHRRPHACLLPSGHRHHQPPRLQLRHHQQLRP